MKKDTYKNDRVYTKFQRHVDNAGEVVSAEHANKMQDALSRSQKDLHEIRDYRFIDKVLFSFDNNLYVNSMFGDEVNSKRYIDFAVSKKIKHDENERVIYVENQSTSGEVYTTKIASSLNDRAEINDFFLITDQYAPQGANIKYYIITESEEVYPIQPNKPKVPTSVHGGVTSVKVKAVMTKNAMGETPKLYGIALLFFDPAVESQYGLINPDLKRFLQEEDKYGLTTIIRDKAQEDKVVEVIEPKMITKLYYDWDKGGELKEVETYEENKAIKITEKLGYGMYNNSRDEDERVLLTILSEEKAVKDTNEDEEIDGN